MADQDKYALHQDPHLPWSGPFPYDRLRRAGIRPSSTARAVNDALYDLMAAGGASHEDRAAWDELHYVDRRLGVDFFLYRLPTAESVTIDSAAAQRPMPVEAPDFRALARVPVDFAAALPEGSPFEDVEECGSTGAGEFGGAPPDTHAPARPHGHTPLRTPDLPPVPPLDIGDVPFHRPRCLERNYGKR